MQHNTKGTCITKDTEDTIGTLALSPGRTYVSILNRSVSLWMRLGLGQTRSDLKPSRYLSSLPSLWLVSRGQPLLVKGLAMQDYSVICSL